MKKGFTLIETLVYLALFSLIVGGMIAAAYLLFESSDRNQTKAMLQEEENFVLNKIVWSLTNAKIVSTPAAGSSGTTLIFTPYGASAVTIQKVSSDVTYNGAILNNSNVSIDGLTYTRTYAGGTAPDSILIVLTMSAKTPNGATLSETATTTKYVRK